jgi:hypothetical protein
MPVSLIKIIKGEPATSDTLTNELVMECPSCGEAYRLWSVWIPMVSDYERAATHDVSRWHRHGCTTRGTKKAKGEKVKRILTIEIEGPSVAPAVVNETKDKIPEGTRVRIVVCDHRSLWDNATWHGKVLRSSFTD